MEGAAHVVPPGTAAILPETGDPDPVMAAEQGPAYEPLCLCAGSWWRDATEIDSRRAHDN